MLAVDHADHQKPLLAIAARLALNERRIEPQGLRLYEVDAVFESVDPALPFVKLEPRQTYAFFIHKVCLF